MPRGPRGGFRNNSQHVAKVGEERDESNAPQQPLGRAGRVEDKLCCSADTPAAENKMHTPQQAQVPGRHHKGLTPMPLLVRCLVPGAPPLMLQLANCNSGFKLLPSCHLLWEPSWTLHTSSGNKCAFFPLYSHLPSQHLSYEPKLLLIHSTFISASYMSGTRWQPGSVPVLREVTVQRDVKTLDKSYKWAICTKSDQFSAVKELGSMRTNNKETGWVGRSRRASWRRYSSRSQVQVEMKSLGLGFSNSKAEEKNSPLPLPLQSHRGA